MATSGNVLIIGAGIAGLALAQILRKERIPCEVFERDDGSRPQGWSVGLDKCLARLKPLLPLDLEPLEKSSPNYGSSKSDNFAVVEPVTHDVIGIIPDPAKGNQAGISASRDVVREILMQSLDVQRNKRFVNYEEDLDGVTAHFADGSIARGKILVGADGSNSLVRRQLLNGYQSAVSAYVMLHGNVALSPEEYGPVLKHSNIGVLLGMPHVKAYLILIKRYSDGTGLFNWSVAYNEHPHNEHEWVRQATAEALHQKALELTTGLPSYFVDAVRKTGPAGTHQPPITLRETVLPVDLLPDGYVTLLGDAAHSMVPFRGMGGNTALLDASELGPALAGAINKGSDVSETLRTYEKKMISRGREQVLESRAAGEAVENVDISGGRMEEQRRAAAVGNIRVS